MATLWYGGGPFSTGQAQAKAAKIVNQSQQLLGAAQMFHMEKLRWRANVQELVTEGYLSSVPTAKREGAFALARAGEAALDFVVTPAYAQSAPAIEGVPLEAGSYPSPCWITTTMPGTCPKGTTCI